MAINLITAPAATPAAVADYTAQNNLIAALALAAQGAARVVGSNVVKGAIFLVGGALYLAAADTSISGAASDYVKLTISGTTLVPSFVADLTGVTWSSTWNGYYDGSGNLYEFDELKALAGAAIAAAALRAIGGKNLGTNWSTILTTAMGTEWKNALITSLGTNWASKLHANCTYVTCPYPCMIANAPTEQIFLENTSYVKIKDILIDKSGTISVRFGLRSGNISEYAYGRIYVNGSAVGTERSMHSITYVYYEETITVAIGDHVQLYCKTDSAPDGYDTKDFSINAISNPIAITLD